MTDLGDREVEEIPSWASMDEPRRFSDPKPVSRCVSRGCGGGGSGRANGGRGVVDRGDRAFAAMSTMRRERPDPARSWLAPRATRAPVLVRVRVRPEREKRIAWPQSRRPGDELDDGVRHAGVRRRPAMSMATPPPARLTTCRGAWASGNGRDCLLRDRPKLRIDRLDHARASPKWETTLTGRRLRIS
jgi:hypothetical protein